MENPKNTDIQENRETQINILKDRLEEIKDEIQQQEQAYNKALKQVNQDLEPYQEWIDSKTMHLEEDSDQFYRRQYQQLRKELRELTVNKVSNLQKLRKEKREIEQKIRELENSRI